MVANADLVEDIHHIKLDPFFDNLSSFDEGDIYEGDDNSLSSWRNALILYCVIATHRCATRDLVAFGDLVFHDGV
jgi:hypothetical protein